MICKSIYLWETTETNIERQILKLDPKKAVTFGNALTNVLKESSDTLCHRLPNCIHMVSLRIP